MKENNEEKIWRRELSIVGDQLYDRRGSIFIAPTPHTGEASTRAIWRSRRTTDIKVYLLCTRKVTIRDRFLVPQYSFRQLPFSWTGRLRLGRGPHGTYQTVSSPNHAP